MKATKAYETWQARIASGQLTKAQTNQFTHAVARRAAGLTPHGRPTNLTSAEAVQLVHQINAKPVQLTGKHVEQGITWFARHAEKALQLTGAEVLDIVNHFDHFSWDGTIEVFGPYDNSTVPVWTVHLDDGRELRYHYAPWVDGINESGYTWTKEKVA